MSVQNTEGTYCIKLYIDQQIVPERCLSQCCQDVALLLQEPGPAVLDVVCTVDTAVLDVVCAVDTAVLDVVCAEDTAVLDVVCTVDTAVLDVVCTVDTGGGK